MAVLLLVAFLHLVLLCLAITQLARAVAKKA